MIEKNSSCKNILPDANHLSPLLQLLTALHHFPPSSKHNAFLFYKFFNWGSISSPGNTSAGGSRIGDMFKYFGGIGAMHDDHGNARFGVISAPQYIYLFYIRLQLLSLAYIRSGLPTVAVVVEVVKYRQSGIP